MVLLSSVVRRLDRLEKVLPPPPPLPVVSPTASALGRIWETLAIAGVGRPRPDEPLSAAWARVVEAATKERQYKLHRSEIALFAAHRAYFPDVCDADFNLITFRDAANSIPAWLFAFTGLNLAYKVLEWPARDVDKEAEPMTAAAILDVIESWPAMPTGAYFGDFADDAARARWNVILDSARETGFAVCDPFVLISASARHMRHDPDSVTLGTCLLIDRVGTISRTTPDNGRAKPVETLNATSGAAAIGAQPVGGARMSDDRMDMAILSDVVHAIAAGDETATIDPTRMSPAYQAVYAQALAAGASAHDAECLANLDVVRRCYGDDPLRSRVIAERKREAGIVE
jgi:hypothetical protein